MTSGVHQETVLEATGVEARIARVYAEALRAAAKKAGEVDTIGEEMAAIIGVLPGHPAIREFFANDTIGQAAKSSALAVSFENGSSKTFRNFLGLLNQNRRLGLLRAIYAAYESMRDDAAGRVRVRVTSAAPLNEAQTASLKATLAERLKAEPIFTVTTDPELLGGLIVQVGDRVYDTSVRSRLETLRTHLMTSGTHGA